MLNIELSNGFVAQIKTNALKDMNAVKLMVAYEKEPTNFDLFESLLNKVFGEDQAVKFIESFTDDDGCIPIDAVMNGYKELLTKGTEQSKELKN